MLSSQTGDRLVSGVSPEETPAEYAGGLGSEGVDALREFVSSGGTLVCLGQASGLGKTPFFGLLIATIGCHRGLTTRGGTEGVGKSTTQTVVMTSIAVLLSFVYDTWCASVPVPRVRDA